MTQSSAPEVRLPWGTTDHDDFTREGTILASVMGRLAVFVTPPLGIVGMVLSCRDSTASVGTTRRHGSSWSGPGSSSPGAP